MKREILFRGKSEKTNNFIYGSLVIRNSSSGLKYCIYNSQGAFVDYVVKKTTGQYTGLTDKNGVKVFDGDLLEDNYNEEETLIDGKVEVVFDVKKAEWAIDNSFKQDKSSFTSLVGYFGDELKVIGNIHDNEK